MANEVQWSELQRDPKSVAALTDRGDVHVRRRDGADLLLMREDRAVAAAQGALTAARAVRNLFFHAGPDVASEALLDEFPWISVLPKSDRAQFLMDFVQSFQASADLGQWSLLATTVREWKSTAVIYTDPELAQHLTQPLHDDLGPVPSPQDA